MSRPDVRVPSRCFRSCRGSLFPLSEFADPSFCNSLCFSNFGAKRFRREDLAQSGWCSSFPVVTGYGVRQPGQIRDKHWAGDPGFGGWILVVLSGVTMVAVLPGREASDKRAIGKTSESERTRLHDETIAAADRIAAEAHSKLPRSKAAAIGAIYVRFSTLFQDSAVDQIRELYQFAVENKIFVPREYVFFDLGVRGYKNQREGLDQLRTVLAAKRVHVLLLFATNRLFRKVYLTLQFVEQAVVENGIRCVFVKSGVDTANKDQWQPLLQIRAMVDEFQVRVNADHIRAALEGMFLDGLVRGTLPLGYKGEPIPGKRTKRGRSRCRIVVDCEGAKLVLQIFDLFVESRLSIVGIAQKLNAMADVSQAAELEPVDPQFRACPVDAGGISGALEVQRYREEVPRVKGLHSTNPPRETAQRGRV